MITPLTPADLTLETDRLILTPFEMGDVDCALAVLTDPEIMYYVADEPMAPADVHAEMPHFTRRGAGGRLGIWCVTLKSTGEKIGTSVLTPIPIDQDDTDWMSLVPDAYPDAPIETGYLLLKSHWGQGLATEICARLLRFAFEMTTLDAVYALTDPGNKPSQNVVAKCGLRYLKRTRAYGEDNVDWFRIDRADWQEA